MVPSQELQGIPMARFHSGISTSICCFEEFPHNVQLNGKSKAGKSNPNALDVEMPSQNCRCVMKG